MSAGRRISTGGDFTSTRKWRGTGATERVLKCGVFSIAFPVLQSYLWIVTGARRNRNELHTRREPCLLGNAIMPANPPPIRTHRKRERTTSHDDAITARYCPGGATVA